MRDPALARLSLVCANRKEQGGQLHEHGDAHDSSGDVHTVLGLRVRTFGADSSALTLKLSLEIRVGSNQQTDIFYFRELFCSSSHSLKRQS